MGDLEDAGRLCRKLWEPFGRQISDLPHAQTNCHTFLVAACVVVTGALAFPFVYSIPPSTVIVTTIPLTGDVRLYVFVFPLQVLLSLSHPSPS